MATEQYKCPGCGADMMFDTHTGMLHCDSCGRAEEIKSSEPKSSVNMNSSYEGSHASYGDNEVVHYQCQNCGAVLTTDANTSATTCSFCGAAVILSDRLSGVYSPNKIIPFKISKQEAQTAFKKWCKKGLLTPKEFKAADRVKDITGIYIPFWLYDLNVIGEAEATCTKVRHYSQGEYDVRETKYYEVSRTVDLNFNRIPTDASKRMDDRTMDLLEPFNYGELTDFSSPFLAGYIAEKYDQTDSELIPRVEARADEFTEDYIRSTIVGYSSVMIRNKRCNMNLINRPDYALLPVWIVSYDFKDKNHLFAMNGQTGKIIGKPPISKGKVAAWFTGIFAVSFGLCELVYYLLELGGVI